MTPLSLSSNLADYSDPVRPPRRRVLAVALTLVGLLTPAAARSGDPARAGKGPDVSPGAGDTDRTAARLAVTPGCGRVPCLTDAEAWRRLPRADAGRGRTLPGWARALAETLPRTTAAMLELDYLHRARSPLDPKLRGRLRWVAAHAYRCPYGEAYALADLRRAGLSEAALRSPAGPAGLSARERAALAFARKLTLAASTVTDEEVAQLLRDFGEKQVVAMVLAVAYANFQDRLLLTLGVPVEDGGPLPPLDVRFTGDGAEVPAARRPEPTPRKGPAVAEKVADPEWLALDWQKLRRGMERQKARKPRLPLPEDDRSRVRWSVVGQTYQPELAAAWSACTRAFAKEARQDPVFEETLFWVITRTLQCFY